MNSIHSRRIGMLLPRVLTLKMAAVDKVFAPLGLTHSAWVALMVIARYPGKSTHALADLCFVTDQSFGQSVSKLAKHGLVERKQGFGRAIIHELTEAGRAIFDEAQPLMHDAMENFLSPLSESEMETMADLLERISVHATAMKNS